MIIKQYVKAKFDTFLWWINSKGITPNHITFGSIPICIIGWLIWIYYLSTPWKSIAIISIILVTFSKLLDLVDGYYARLVGKVTRFGGVVDPIADKFRSWGTTYFFWQSIHLYLLVYLIFLDVLSSIVRKFTSEGANDFGKHKGLSHNISMAFFWGAVVFNQPFSNLLGNCIFGLACIFGSISVGIRLLKIHWIRVLIPQIITGGNLGLGIFAILMSFWENINIAVICIFGAIILDLFDGMVARKLNVMSKFGGKFDSVADFVSFGIAPSFLIAEQNNYNLLSLISGGIYIVLTLFRLNDYGRNEAITPNGFFRGFPSPAAAWLVISAITLQIPILSIIVQIIAAFMMVKFNSNWIKFSNVYKRISLNEYFAAIILGLICFYQFNPFSFIIGPILVYAFSIFEHKPNIKS